MRRFTEHKLLIFLIVSTIIAAAVIGIFSARKGTSAVENAVGTVVSPMQNGASSAGGFLGRLGELFGNTKGLREENEQLKNEVTNLRKMLQESEGLEKENDELRDMLSLKKSETQIEMVAASIAAYDPSNWYSSFTINKGSNDGVEQNQSVVNSNRELVGQIMRVGENWAEVITILDSQSSVGALVRRSKTTGIVEGDGSLRFNEKCRFGYVSRDADIKVGDYVETSGLGGIYPKGLLVGVITDVQEDNSTMSKTAVVEPLAKISAMSEVFVITSYEETDLSENGSSEQDNNDEEDIIEDREE